MGPVRTGGRGVLGENGREEKQGQKTHCLLSYIRVSGRFDDRIASQKGFYEHCTPPAGQRRPFAGCSGSTRASFSSRGRFPYVAAKRRFPFEREDHPRRGIEEGSHRDSACHSERRKAHARRER